MGGKATKTIHLHQGPADGKTYKYPSPLPKTLVISQVSHTKDSMGVVNGGVLVGQHDYERLRDTMHYLWKGKAVKSKKPCAATESGDDDENINSES